MTAKEQLDHLLNTMPEEQVREILDYAQFLSWKTERADWRQFGLSQLARAYSPDEPEYSEADLKTEPGP